jgi:hypothetical protein
VAVPHALALTHKLPAPLDGCPGFAALVAVACSVKIFDGRDSITGHVPCEIAHTAATLAICNAQAATTPNAILKLGLARSPVRRVDVTGDLILIGVAIKDPDATYLAPIGIHSSHPDA